MIKILATKKAPRPDRLCNRTLKALNMAKLTVLPALFSAHLCLGCFPITWREGTTPIRLKPGEDLSNVDSYQPLILLSSLGKVYERILNKLLKAHYSSNKPLQYAQFGFHIGTGTEETLHDVIFLIKHSRNSNMSTYVISFYLKCAFDYAEWLIIFNNLK